MKEILEINIQQTTNRNYVGVLIWLLVIFIKSWISMSKWLKIKIRKFPSDLSLSFSTLISFQGSLFLTNIRPAC